MDFLTGPNVGRALRLWRIAKKLKLKDVAENSEKVSKRPVASSNLSAWETGGKGVSYKNLVENLLPAYGIRDICDYDIFLDYCLGPSEEMVTVIRQSGRSDLKDNATGTHEWLVSPKDLKGNRSRISVIEINPGGRTKWQNHEGHEYVMVARGQVVLEYARSEHDRPRTVTLGKLDGVAFSSSVYHSFSNKGTSTAELIIARPTNSLPKGMQETT
jgi:quercetin dioxygenase-like cupin family protein